MEYVMIRIALAAICVLALAIPADAAPRRTTASSGCTGDHCIANALLHPFQTIGNVADHVVRHPQKLPEGPPAAPAAAPPAAVYSAPASTATATGHRFHIFHRNSGRGSGGGCGCGR